MGVSEVERVWLNTGLQETSLSMFTADTYIRVMREISLIVDNATPTDQGFGKIRLDPASMEMLRVTPGSIVRITKQKSEYQKPESQKPDCRNSESQKSDCRNSEFQKPDCRSPECRNTDCQRSENDKDTTPKSTVAKVWRALAQDWNQKKARIDKYIRANADVSPGDRIIVSRIDEEVAATFVEITPEPGIPEHFLNEQNFDAASVINFPISLGDILPIRTHMLAAPIIEFKVTALEPENACIISKDTEFEINDEAEFEGAAKITYEDIGGLKNELARVREMIELPIRHPELFEAIGVEPPKGVLLYGPPGTGKTLIAKAVANESGASFFSIAGPEIISKYYGESEEKLREIFEEAERKSPSIIFIDELDAIAPRRDEVTGEVERRVVAQLLTMLDGISSRGQVIVIGATNRPESIDVALRRPGRFDREIEIGVPSEADRVEILKIHTKNMPLEGAASLYADGEPSGMDVAVYECEREKLLGSLAASARGFVGADLAALAREAAVVALRRQVNTELLENETIPDSELRKLEVTMGDFVKAMREITPSAMREISFDAANVSWTDIGGSKDAIQSVRESIEYPLTQKERFKNLGIRPPKGVLLYGPPGSGKTLIAKAVAHESGANFIAIKGPELLSKWVGESERAVRDIFKKARQVAPSVVFFDEIDSLTPPRGNDAERTLENVLNQILVEMDGIEELSDVVVLAASNRPDIIDPALLRSGRFDRLIYIEEPNEADRRSILSVHMRAIPLEGSSLEKIVADLSIMGINEDDIECLAKQFHGKTVTRKQIKSAAKDLAVADAMPSQRATIRQNIVSQFVREEVVIKDPVRDKLLDSLSRETKAYVGSDLESLCREAAMMALRDGRNAVSPVDFEDAKELVHPTMNPRVAEYYDSIRRKFKGGLSKDVQNLVEYQ